MKARVLEPRNHEAPCSKPLIIEGLIHYCSVSHGGYLTSAGPFNYYGNTSISDKARRYKLSTSKAQLKKPEAPSRTRGPMGGPTRTQSPTGAPGAPGALGALEPKI